MKQRNNPWDREAKRKEGYRALVELGKPEAPGVRQEGRGALSRPRDMREGLDPSTTYSGSSEHPSGD